MGSSSKTKSEDNPKPLTMLFVNLCVPSVHCHINSTAYFDLSLKCMFKHMQCLFTMLGYHNMYQYSLYLYFTLCIAYHAHFVQS